MAEQGISMNNEPPKPAYRGAMVQNRATHDDLVDTGAKQAGKSAASMQSTKFGGQADNVMTLETDAAAPNSKGAQKVEIQVIGGDAPAAAPVATKLNINEVSHTTVPNTSPEQVLSQLTSTIGSYSDAVHTIVDEANLSISGTAFVGDYHAVHFKIDVTADADGKASHFEFLRTSGSALAAAKFLGIVNRVFKDQQNSAPKKQRSSSGNLMIDAVVNAVYDAVEEAAAAEEQSLVALDISADALDLKMDDAAQEKMEVMDALNADDTVGIEMDGASEQYLTQKLVEGGAISGDATVDHKGLIEVLLEENVLGDGDVAVVRAASLILAKLVNGGFVKEIVNADAFEAISGAAAKANVLARRYLVRLLSAMAKSEAEWTVPKEMKDALVSAVKAVEAELGQGKDVEFQQREFADVDCDAVLKKLEA